MDQAAEQRRSPQPAPPAAPVPPFIPMACQPPGAKRLVSLDTLAGLVTHLLRADACVVYLVPVDGSPMWGFSGLGEWCAETCPCPDPTVRCLSTSISHQPRRVADLQTPELTGEPFARAGMASCVGVPILVGSESIGMVSVAERQGGRLWTESEVDLVRQVAAPLVMELAGERRDASGAPAPAVAGSSLAPEHRSLEAQLRHAQRMEALGRIASGFAHDFNNLLTVIHGHASMALMDCAGDDLARVHLTAIEQAAVRAEALARELQAFSRKQRPQSFPLDLNHVLEESRALICRLVGKEVSVDLRLAHRLPAVEVDPGQIEQAVMNLAANARDAMPGGGRITISTAAVELRPEDAARLAPELAAGVHVRVSVADEGTGIPADILPRIFEPFFTTKAGGQAAGLGLTTAADIAKQSGGHLSVESEPDTGAVFRMWLPAVRSR
jgi:signal transduction histidine kinase